MARVDVWPTIHSEREALVGDLVGITDEQWSTMSLCADWTVQEVLAHMAATAQLGTPQFFGKMIASGFSLKKLQAKDIAAGTSGPRSETLTHFEAQVNSSKHPPGPVDSWLGEQIVHSQDIRRPLGIDHDYPVDAVMQVADFYKSSNLIIGAKRRIDGLTLRATDAEWSHGEGPDVSGPLLSLLMAMTGRQGVMGDLSGDGVSTLRGRP